MTKESITGGGIVASKKELRRGVTAAAVSAAIVLIGAILPAEYGIDPTGIGKSLGLTALYNPVPAVAKAAPAAGSANTSINQTGSVLPTTVPAGSTVSAKGEQRNVAIASKQALPYRSDTMEIEIAPRKGVEVKTHLSKGATLIYSWKTAGGEAVNHDFHGEPVDAGKDEFESFILEKGVRESRGSLIAPFTGVHGWYWKNNSDVPVTVVLASSGFYRDIYKK